ncbi:hypothetical protein [Plantactinospora veratri]
MKALLVLSDSDLRKLAGYKKSELSNILRYVVDSMYQSGTPTPDDNSAIEGVENTVVGWLAYEGIDLPMDRNERYDAEYRDDVVLSLSFYDEDTKISTPSTFSVGDFDAMSRMSLSERTVWIAKKADDWLRHVGAGMRPGDSPCQGSAGQSHLPDERQ